MIDEKRLIGQLASERTKAYIAYEMERGYWDKGYKDGLEFALKKINEQPKVGEWIPVEERMPEEHDSVFAELKGTDKWYSGMFEKMSDEVIVACEYGDGTRVTKTSKTIDGSWLIEAEAIFRLKVIFWQPLPELYEEKEDD